MATNTNSLLNSVPKLNGQNYHDLKFAISMVLRRSGCWDVITEQAWKALKKIYGENSRANRLALKRQYYGCHHDPERPIREYIAVITGLATRLKAIGVKLEDIGPLLDEEGRRGGPPVQHGTESALRASHQITCSNCKKQGHRKADCWARGGDWGGQRKCFKCHKEGQLAYQCPDES
ncbi:hypothetical protein B0H13DRAFT_1861685 [Mycena leptocephala]|nr:hypothetical protein B0H13DRAFT_1861685 [Mycena leptocephala]